MHTIIAESMNVSQTKRARTNNHHQPVWRSGWLLRMKYPGRLFAPGLYFSLMRSISSGSSRISSSLQLSARQSFNKVFSFALLMSFASRSYFCREERFIPARSASCVCDKPAFCLAVCSLFIFLHHFFCSFSHCSWWLSAYHFKNSPYILFSASFLACTASS